MNGRPRQNPAYRPVPAYFCSDINGLFSEGKQVHQALGGAAPCALKSCGIRLAGYNAPHKKRPGVKPASRHQRRLCGGLPKSKNAPHKEQFEASD